MKRGMLDIAADMLKSDLQGIKSFIQATHKGLPLQNLFQFAMPMQTFRQMID